MGEKINIERLNIIGLILFMVGLLFIGSAITGKAISNTSSDYCSLDAECADGKICCIISGAIGMCQELEICNELKFNLGLETPLERDYSFYMNIGINFVIFAVIIFIIGYYSYQKERRRGNPRNSGNKKFKRKK